MVEGRSEWIISIKRLAVWLLLLLWRSASEPAIDVASSSLASGRGSARVCALRDAITAANTQVAVNGCAAGTGTDTITFSVSGTITLSSALPAIANASTGSLTIDGSGQTIAGAGAYQVLVVDSGTTLTLNNLTIENGSSASGGGVYNGGTLTVTNTTFSGNSASLGGGGIYNGGTATVSNSILANEDTGGNCSGTITYGTKSGYNISDDGTCVFGTTSTGANGDPIGDNVNPLLATDGLQNNGGPTETIALQATSPAVETVPLADCTVTTDQRGAPRPAPGYTACDIGAFEYGGVVPSPSRITSMTLTVVGDDGLPPMPDSVFKGYFRRFQHRT